MKVTTYIAKFLKSKEIDTVFELQGGMITRIIDELHHQKGFKIVSMHHEQAVAFAVDAYSRITNKPGIGLATSGPGATNLITGIGSCYFDSVPAIFITGQVNINEQKGDKPTRQIGFQETDIISIVKTITKGAYAVRDAKRIPEILDEAYNLASGGRPGPVLIDIPMNVQLEETGLSYIRESESVNNFKSSNDTKLFIKDFVTALKASKKPLVLCGRGIRASGSIKIFREFIDRFHLPVVYSLLGADSIPYDSPDRIGFIGTYGNRWANYALGSCDLLLVLGSRLDLRQTGSDTGSFRKGKQIFHVDIDPAELNNRIKGCETLNEDLTTFLDQILKRSTMVKEISEWTNEINYRKAQRPDTSELNNLTGINPNDFMHRLARVSHLAGAVTTDVGNNQMWAAQSFEIQHDQRFLSNGGMGAMGYSLPAAIGSSIALGNLPVISIIGDGGFQINIQELQTIRRNNLPVKIVILNNHCLGMIRQFQDSYFESCYQSTVWGYDTPDFEKVSKAYNIEASTIERPEEIESSLEKLWNNTSEPYLLTVSLDIHTNVFPKMMYGNPITNMEPR
jgi:acetolactate synthase I/II/III large subunit